MPNNGRQGFCSIYSLSHLGDEGRVMVDETPPSQDQVSWGLSIGDDIDEGGT